MSSPFYRQCAMKSGNTHQVAWIPEKFAEVGRVLILGKRTADAPRWTVTIVGDLRLEEAYLVAHERDYKTQREASDI